MDWLSQREGWNEAKNNAELSIYWKYTNCKQFTDVRGREHAWCAMTANAALIESGFEGTHDAAAFSFSDYGDECSLQYGAIIILQHPNGSHHVTFFTRWLDKEHNLIELFGGNQSDSIKKSIFNVSGNANGHDEIIAIRWPKRSIS